MVSQYQASASWTYRHGLTRISKLAQVNRVQLAASIQPIRPGLVPVWYGAQGQPQGRDRFVSALWSHRRCRYRRRAKHSRSHLGDFREPRVPGASKGCRSVGVISDYSFLNSEASDNGGPDHKCPKKLKPKYQIKKVPSSKLRGR